MKRIIVMSCASLLAACASLGSGGADPGRAEALFERFKALEGQWVSQGGGDEAPQESVVTYEVTAAGSAVLERVFAGTEHEMVTMYHLDGGDLMLTHYCAAGNQPTMLARPGSGSDRVEFSFVRGTNMDAKTDGHMHEAAFTFVDADHLRSVWTFYENGEPAEEHGVDLVRRM